MMGLLVIPGKGWSKSMGQPGTTKGNGARDRAADKATVWHEKLSRRQGCRQIIYSILQAMFECSDMSLVDIWCHKLCVHLGQLSSSTRLITASKANKCAQGPYNSSQTISQTESQNSWGWKVSLEAIWSNPNAQAGTTRGGSPGVCPAAFEGLQRCGLQNLPR